MRDKLLVEVELFKIVWIAVVMTVVIAHVYAVTFEELPNLYNYDFSDGSLNVSSTSAVMSDTNSNSINDLLTITVTTNASIGNVTVYVNLDDPAGLLVGKNTSTGTSFPIYYNSSIFSQNNLNYSIRIEDVDGLLIFEKHGYQTDNLGTYENGTNLSKIYDANINNNRLRITLTVNVTKNDYVNTTVILAYADTHISATTNHTLNTSNNPQNITIDFDNETLKATHYQGVFLIDTIIIGDKLINTNQNTSNYSYQTFAQTSFFEEFDDNLTNTSENLSEYLNLYFTVDIKTADNYTIITELFDSYGNFVAFINQTDTLSTGQQVIMTQIPGEDIYKSAVDGPYTLSYAILLRDDTADDVYLNAHTTPNYAFYEFTRPPQPDIIISMREDYNTSTKATNITIHITNNGTADAFNALLDVYDNTSFEGNGTIPYLAVNQSKLFNFTVPNTSNQSIILAIVDLTNLVDEQDESNNIATNNIPTDAASANFTVRDLQVLSIDENNVTFEFFIDNLGTEDLNNLSWSLDTQDTTIMSTIPLNLSIGQTAAVYLEYAYGASGSYTVHASANAGNEDASDTMLLELNTTNVTITTFSKLHSTGLSAIFEFLIQNLFAEPIYNINWTFNTGEGIIRNSSIPINLSSQQEGAVYIAYQYNTSGTYTVRVNVTYNGSTEQATIPITI